MVGVVVGLFVNQSCSGFGGFEWQWVVGDGWLLRFFLPVVAVGGGCGFAGLRRGNLLVVLAFKKRERDGEEDRERD